MNNLKPTGSSVWQIVYLVLIGAVMLAVPLLSPLVHAEELGSLKWKYETGDYVNSSPTIAEDGTVYVGSDDGYLYAINPNGYLKWRYYTGYAVRSTAISSDGTIYAVSADGCLYALHPDGDLKWKYRTGDSIYFSPAIGPDGNVYVTSHDNHLYALNPDGSLKWKYETGYKGGNSPAIGPDGTIYVSSFDDYLYAIDQHGHLKWRYKPGLMVVSSPAISSDGTIYVGSANDGPLYALHPDGNLKWKYEAGGAAASSPAIAEDGTVYVGSGDGHLYAINPYGSLKWKYETGNDVFSSPAIAEDGTVYVGSGDGHLYALNPDGSLKWRFETGGQATSPAIASDGTVYVGSDDHHLYTLNSSSKGLADSPWPMFGGNLKRTSRVGTERVIRAKLTVKVTDNSGEDLDARIYLDGEYKGGTGWNGEYKMSDLSPDNYRVRAEKEGYLSNSKTLNLSAGEKEELTLTLRKENKPPTASFTYSPKTPKSDQPVTFNSNSNDPDGSVDKYRWTFGDGSSSSSKDPTHAYSQQGTYTVELEVTDEEGATDSATKEVMVENKKPTAKFTYSPKEPNVGQKVTFDATSSTDPDGTIESYSWDLNGDGTTDKSGSKVSYTYSTKGTYTVKLTVTDNNGATASTEKQIKLVEKQETEEEVKIENKYALVIGIADYKYDTINDLKYPAQDAKDFYQFLISDNYESFPKEKVTLLTNKQATTQAISKEMSRLVTEVDDKDLVIIYYSGHGAPGPDYNGDEEDGYDEYYVTYDTNTSSGAKLYSTGISDDEFGNWLTSMDSKQVAIFLDSCYSGGATKATKGTNIPGQKAIPKNEVFNDFSFENRLLFAASQENQPSWESPKLNQGVFTHFLLKGLKGEADTNNDGEVTSDELYDYLKPNVSSYVEEHFTSTQTPLMKGAIGAPLSEEKGRFDGEVKYVIGENEEANKGDYVMTNLGRKDDISTGDTLKVLMFAKGVGVVEKVFNKIEITKVAGPHLAVGKVMKSDLTVEKGFKVRKVESE